MNLIIAVFIIYLYIYGLIIDPHNYLLPVGLIAQLLEHCPFRPRNFQVFLAAAA